MKTKINRASFGEGTEEAFVSPGTYMYMYMYVD